MATNTRGPIARSSSNNSKPTSNKSSFRWKQADPSWHPEVIGLYNSLRKLEHASEFQEADMYYARLIAIEHSTQLDNDVDKNAALLKLIFEQWKELGATLGTRRRLAIEAQKVEEEKNTGKLMSQMAQAVLTGKPL